MTKLRPFALGLFAVAALAVAGCGSDDDKSSDSATTSATPSATRGYSASTALKDVPPRASKPNIVGGDAPIEELAERAANDSIGYWDKVFSNSGLTYAKPAASVATSPQSACNGEFDPAAKAMSLCAKSGGSTILLGGPKLDAIRSSAGDAAPVFLAGFIVAADANDQLTGGKIAQGGQPDAQFFATTACFTGAWIKNLADRNVLEAGDDQEVIKTAAAFVNQDPNVGAQAVQQGYNGGAGSCQQGGSGDNGSDDGTTTTDAEPAPSPTP